MVGDGRGEVVAVRTVVVLAGGLAVAALGCLVVAPMARAYEPPEPLTLTDPIGDAARPDGGGPVGPDITSVMVSQPEPDTLRLRVTFADPLVLRETAPVVEDGVGVLLGYQLGSQMYGDYVAWVGAADPSRVLLTDLSTPWHPGSVITGGVGEVDGRVLTLTMPTDPLRARGRSGRTVDPNLPITVSVRTSLGWAYDGPISAMEAVSTGDATPDGGGMRPFAWSGPAEPTPLSNALSAGGGALAALAAVLLLGAYAWGARSRRLEAQRADARAESALFGEFQDVELLSSGR